MQLLMIVDFNFHVIPFVLANLINLDKFKENVPPSRYSQAPSGRIKIKSRKICES